MLTCPAAEMADGSKVLYFEQVGKIGSFFWIKLFGFEWSCRAKVDLVKGFSFLFVGILEDSSEAFSAGMLIAHDSSFVALSKDPNSVFGLVSCGFSL